MSPLLRRCERSLQQYKASAVLLDLDGTLLDSAPDLAFAVDTVLGDYGYAAAGEANARNWIGSGAQVLVQRALANAKQVPQEAIGAEELALAVARFKVIYRNCCCDQSSLYPGVIDGLQLLRTKAKKLAIVTNKPFEFSAAIIGHYGLEQFADTLVGGDSLATKKPDPAMLLYAADRLDVAIGDCVMVGDSSADILAGKNAGIAALAVSYGYHRGANLTQLGADRVFDNFYTLCESLV